MKSTKKSPKNNARQNPGFLTPVQLKTRQNQASASLKVIDIRGRLEYWLGHIPGAERFSRSRVLKEIPKDQPLAVTCLSGHRSAIAAHWLISQGYRQIYSLQGGLLAWQQTGFPVQRGTRP